MKISLPITIVGLILTISGVYYITVAQPALLKLSADIFPVLRIFTPKADLPTPSPTPISKVAPVEIRTVQGVILKFNNSILSIKIDGETKNFIISKTFDIQRLTSGTISGGDAKTVPISFQDLDIGQEVLVIAEKDTNFARSIYILRD